MKMVKSLILGSAAGLVAMSGAQAADLPVKAKAVEYVRICSLYGAGFFYIPGTDTCIKLGGYLRVDVVANSNSDAVNAASGVAGAQNRYRNYFTARSREDFNIDTRTATEYGVLRTFFDATFSWTTGSVAPAATGSVYTGSGIAGGDQPGIYYAFIQFAGFTLGKAISQFSPPWTNYPANAFDGLVGGSGDVTGVNQLSYTANFGNGVSGTLSAQEATQYFQSGVFNSSFPGVTGPIVGTSLAAATPYGINSQGGTVAPDLVAMLRVDQAWGLFQASFAAHDNHAGYYVLTNEASGHPDDVWGWAAQLALSIKNIPTGPGDTINISGVYTDGATRYNIQDLAANSYAMFGGTGAIGAYQSLGFAQATDTVFANGTSQQKTQTWGFRGGYTHNWDPYWNSSIFGAYAAVHYNATATAMVCANVALAAVPGTGFACNPDFNIAQLGFRTAWTPVKNLTFSGDLVWTNLDQKYAGQVALPAIAGIAKPAANYELKDQNTLTLLLRAQRTW
jgi:porin-like protein